MQSKLHQAKSEKTLVEPQHCSEKKDLQKIIKLINKEMKELNKAQEAYKFNSKQLVAIFQVVIKIMEVGYATMMAKLKIVRVELATLKAVEKEEVKFYMLAVKDMENLEACCVGMVQ